jgi:hypothetical protein
MIASQTIEPMSTMLLVIAVTMKPASTLFMPHPSNGHCGETGKGRQYHL